MLDRRMTSSHFDQFMIQHDWPPSHDRKTAMPHHRDEPWPFDGSRVECAGRDQECVVLDVEAVDLGRVLRKYVAAAATRRGGIRSAQTAHCGASCLSHHLRL